MRIIITGTPGTGKTKTAKALEKYGIKTTTLSFCLKSAVKDMTKKEKQK